eukprot:TRINITY_DN29000_c0_g1_i1.p1 TRINITY_DN29000_c0_g1~~TRINITY_DN29000_c0_g1_i1.p1  ORF type:complete len:211 (-),score=23.08 TRINITY_DN29000_c0_g1_i1:15-626(-)
MDSYADDPCHRDDIDKGVNNVFQFLGGDGPLKADIKRYKEPSYKEFNSCKYYSGQEYYWSSIFRYVPPEFFIFLRRTCKAFNDILRDEVIAFDFDTMNYMALHGHLSCLQYLHDECGYEWDESTCAHAAQGGHLPCLVYLHERGCPWDHTAAKVAIQNHHDNCLNYALANGCPRCSDADIMLLKMLDEEASRQKRQIWREDDW